MATVTPALPNLRADRRGYVLEDENVDGFGDRTDLTDEARLRLARWAERFTPAALESQQAALLDRTPDPASRPSDALLALLLDAEKDVSATYALGFYDDLSREELERVRDPSLSVEGASYPLTMDQMQKVTGASKRQLRYWETIGLLPSHRVNGRRVFGSAAVARALALKDCQQHEVAALAAVARGGPEAARLARLVAAQIGTIADRIAGAPGRELAGAAALIVERSHELASAVLERTAGLAETDSPSARSTQSSTRTPRTVVPASKNTSATGIKSRSAAGERAAKKGATASRSTSGGKASRPVPATAKRTGAKKSRRRTSKPAPSSSTKP